MQKFMMRIQQRKKKMESDGAKAEGIRLKTMEKIIGDQKERVYLCK